MSTASRISNLRKLASQSKSTASEKKVSDSISKLTLLGKRTTNDKLITVKIKNDLDIIHVHTRIIQKLQEKRDTNEISEQIKECNAQLDAELMIVDRKFYEKKIIELTEQLENVEQNALYQEYMERAHPYIEAYKKMGSLVVSFNSENANCDAERLRGTERFNIILSYLDVAKSYHKIDVTYDLGDEPVCNMCGSINIEEDFGGNINDFVCFWRK